MLNEVFLRVSGTVRFEATNGFCERLINLCAHNNINLINLESNDLGITASVASYDFKKVSEFAKKVNVQINVLSKKGAWYTTKKYKGRWGIALGIFIFFAALMISSGYIWDVTVVGNQELSTSEILSELSDLGIKPGVKTDTLDLFERKQQALLRMPELAWLTLNLHGSRIEAIVSERYTAPIIKDSTPCDIVAAKSGQIKYMRVYEGVSVIGEGYPVQAGDLLVSGKFVNKQNETTLLHSDAKIIAQVQFDKTLSVDMAQLAKKYTGKKKSRHYINVLSAKLPLFVATKVKGDFDIVKSSKPLRLFGRNIPVSVTTHKYTFYDKVGENLTKSQAEQVLAENFKKFELLELSNSVILKRERTTVIKNDRFIVTTAYTVEQDISKKIIIE